MLAQSASDQRVTHPGHQNCRGMWGLHPGGQPATPHPVGGRTGGGVCDGSARPASLVAEMSLQQHLFGVGQITMREASDSR